MARVAYAPICIGRNHAAPFSCIRHALDHECLRLRVPSGKCLLRRRWNGQRFDFSGPFNSGTLSEWDITTGGGLLTELNYQSPASSSSFASMAIWEGGQPVFFFSVPGQRTLQLMLPASGSIELESGTLQLSSDSAESASKISRRIVEGSVYVERQPTPTTVPEPQTWTMMLLGAMLVSAWFMRRSVIRRKRHDTLA